MGWCLRLKRHLQLISPLYLKASTLPTKPCCTTSLLVGKAYMVAGQAGVCYIHWASCKHTRPNCLGTWTRAKVWDSTAVNNCIVSLIYLFMPPRRWPAPLATPCCFGGYWEVPLAEPLWHRGERQSPPSWCPAVSSWSLWRCCKLSHWEISETKKQSAAFQRFMSHHHKSQGLLAGCSPSHLRPAPHIS